MTDTLDKISNIAHKFITGVLIPVMFYVLGHINEIKNELLNFEVKMAQESARYAMRDDIVRVEGKIDELKTLIIQGLNFNQIKM